MYRVPKQRIPNADYVFPRTLEQAFGPDERGPLVERDAPKPMDWEDKLVLWVAPAVLLFVTLLLMMESA
jgi:hypothetical protein